MRTGWVGNPRLRDLVQRSDPGAHLLAEVVTVGNADTKDLQSEWEAGTTTGSIDTPTTGGARLGAGTTAEVTQATDDATEVSKLTPLPPFAALLIQWTDADAGERELKNMVARLHPRPDNLQAKDVAEWRLQAFRVTEYGPEEPRILVAPISQEVIVEAVGESASNVDFDFWDGGDYPRVGPPPFYHEDYPGTPQTQPQTILRIIALNSDGEPASNVAWLANSALGGNIVSGAADVTHYEFIEPNFKSGDETGGSVWAIDVMPANMPRFTLNAPTYAAGSVTFDGANAIPNLTGTGDLEIVANGRTPDGTTLTFKIWNGAAYIECKSADLVGVDNTAQGGEDLSGVPTVGPWNMKVELAPSGSGRSTPWARELGIQRVETTDLFGLAVVTGGRMKIDPVSLKGNIPSAEIKILKTGARDFRDYGTTILAENHIGDINVRLWIGDPNGTYLDRSEWMHHSTWEVEDYRNEDDGQVLECYSPMRRMRTPIPEFVDTGGGSGERTAISYENRSPKYVWDDIVDGRVGLPGRLRGPGVEDDANTISKDINDVDAKDELDRVAYLVGYSNIDSQGKVKAVPVMRDGAGAGTPVAFFPIGSYDPVFIGPGFKTRTDEFFVPLDWDAASESFGTEVRVFNATAFTKLGGAGLTTTQKLEPETAKWITTDALALEIARRVPQHFGNGLIVWEIKPIYLHPHLEVGDVVVIETNQFVARSPITDREIRGPVATLAVVVDNHGEIWGRHLSLWVPGFDGIVESTGDIDWIHFRKPRIVTGQIVPQDDDSIRFQGTTTQAASIKAAISNVDYPIEAVIITKALQLTDAAGRFDFEIAPPGTYPLADPLYVAALAYEKADGSGAVSPEPFEVNLVREATLLTLSTILLEAVPQESGLVKMLQSFNVGPGVNSVQIAFSDWRGFPGPLTNFGYDYPVEVDPDEDWSEFLRAEESSAWDTITENAGAQIQGGAAVGVTSIIVDDAVSLTGFVTHGDHLVFDSDPGQEYKIRADATAGGNQITLLISPDIQIFIPDNDGVTIYNHPVFETLSDEAAHSLAFHGTILTTLGTELGTEAGIPTPVVGEIYKPKVDQARTMGAGVAVAGSAGTTDLTKADAVQVGGTLQKDALAAGRPYVGLFKDVVSEGAVGDGAALNLTEFQAASDAVQAAAAGVGAVTIPHGIWLLEAGDWDVDKGTDILGEGAGNTILRAQKTAVVSGTADSSTATSLTELLKGLTPNAHVGSYLELTSGTGSDLNGDGITQVRKIISNTADTFNIDPDAEWDEDPDGTTGYKVWVPTRILITGQNSWHQRISDFSLDGVDIVHGLTAADWGQGATIERVEAYGGYKSIEFVYHSWLTKVINCRIWGSCFGIYHDYATPGAGSGAAMEIIGTDVYNCHDAIITDGVPADGFHLQIFGGSHEHNYHSSLRVIDGSLDGVIDYHAGHVELNTWAEAGKENYAIDNDGAVINIMGFWTYPATTNQTAVFRIDGSGRVYLRGGMRLSVDVQKLVHFAGAGFLILDSDQGLSSMLFFGKSAAQLATAGSSALGKILNGGIGTGTGGGGKILCTQFDIDQTLPGASAGWTATIVNPHVQSPIELIFDLEVTAFAPGGQNTLRVWLNPGGVTFVDLIFPNIPVGNPGGHARLSYTPLGRLFVSMDYDGNFYHGTVADPHAITVQKFIDFGSVGANPSTMLIHSLHENVR